MKQRKYKYRRTLPHLQQEQKAIFASFNTHDRIELAPELRDIVLECCLFQHDKMYWLYAAVVMPEHVHLLFRPQRDETGSIYSLLEIMQNLKSVSAHKINKAVKRTGRVWEAESFDHILRSSEDVGERVQYIRENPVRRRLVEWSGDYRWLWINHESDQNGGRVARLHTVERKP